MRTRAPSQHLTLDEIKELVQKHKELGRKIVAESQRLASHFEKMQEYYSEWEDRMDDIEKIIEQTAEVTGVPKEEIKAQAEEYNMLDDL